MHTAHIDIDCPANVYFDNNKKQNVGKGKGNRTNFKMKDKREESVFRYKIREILPYEKTTNSFGQSKK